MCFASLAFWSENKWNKLKTWVCLVMMMPTELKRPENFSLPVHGTQVAGIATGSPRPQAINNARRKDIILLWQNRYLISSKFTDGQVSYWFLLQWIIWTCFPYMCGLYLHEKKWILGHKVLKNDRKSVDIKMPKLFSLCGVLFLCVSESLAAGGKWLCVCWFFHTNCAPRFKDKMSKLRLDILQKESALKTCAFIGIMKLGSRFRASGRSLKTQQMWRNVWICVWRKILSTAQHSTGQWYATVFPSGAFVCLSIQFLFIGWRLTMKRRSETERPEGESSVTEEGTMLVLFARSEREHTFEYNTTNVHMSSGNCKTCSWVSSKNWTSRTHTKHLTLSLLFSFLCVFGFKRPAFFVKNACGVVELLVQQARMLKMQLSGPIFTAWQRHVSSRHRKHRLCAEREPCWGKRQFHSPLVELLR